MVDRVFNSPLTPALSPRWGERGKYSKLLQGLFFCHPERNEGSQVIENSRFFASLRMTTYKSLGFGSGL
jgi:hypothetical protein